MAQSSDRPLPDPTVVASVAAALSSTFGDFAHHNRRHPVEELIFILLSLQTDEAKYRAAFGRLRMRFPTLAALSAAPETEIFDSIRASGFGQQKASRIRAALDEIRRRNGRLTLAPLAQMSDEAAVDWLTTLPGVGVKTARCILLYSLDRACFPVDTHCWRVTRRLGWAPDRDYESHRQADADALQELVPPRLRRGLHVNMVSLGRSVCTARKPDCRSCPIRRHCMTGSSTFVAEKAARPRPRRSEVGLPLPLPISPDARAL